MRSPFLGNLVPLTLHWGNGSGWKPVRSPSAHRRNDELLAVATLPTGAPGRWETGGGLPASLDPSPRPPAEAQEP
jgi:hypothetical protein